MSLAKDKPRFPVQTDYEDDFNAWLYEQVELLRLRRFGELDLTNLLDELESVGSELLHALESSYRLVISHLLMWQFQKGRRSRSSKTTILRERINVERRGRRSPSLRVQAAGIVADIYPGARREASVQTGLPLDAFPAACPYTLAQLHDEDFLPD